jgi:hypothetical protein
MEGALRERLAPACYTTRWGTTFQVLIIGLHGEGQLQLHIRVPGIVQSQSSSQGHGQLISVQMSPQQTIVPPAPAPPARSWEITRLLGHGVRTLVWYHPCDLYSEVSPVNPGMVILSSYRFWLHRS